MSRKNAVQLLPDEVIRAIHQQDHSLLMKVVTPSTVDLLDKQGRSLLTHLVLHGDEHLLDWVLTQKPMLDLADRNGWTPLYFAAQSYAVEAAKKLLSAGAIVDAQDGYGNTPLWRAVFESRGRGAIIQTLLTHGADATKRNHSDISPIELAYTIANYDVKQFFPR